MHALPVVVAMLLLTGAVTGAVCAVTPSGERPPRRGLLVGSIVVGVLAVTSIALTLPSSIAHARVIVITHGGTP